MPKQKANHPWIRNTKAQVSEQRAKKKAHEQRMKQQSTNFGWSCPSCGNVSCSFGECSLNGSF